MQQVVADFIDECETLEQLLLSAKPDDWTRQTQFLSWTLESVLLHLHFWNSALDTALLQPEEFAKLIAQVGEALPNGGLRALEDSAIKPRGEELFEEWRSGFRQMQSRWSALDPKQRVAWAGPSMSVRSAITARQMETWAHGQEIFDLLGQQRQEADRLKNIVMLCVNTYDWSFKVRGREAPGPMPQLKLQSPSGLLWEFGQSDGINSISGSAVGFAQVNAQTRNAADTDLVVSGPIATDWMANAQCFAGPPEQPPVAGSRHRNVYV